MRSKKQIQLKIDRQSLVRDALVVMKRDISKAFNYYDFHAELYNETQKERIARCEKNNKPTTPTNPPGAGSTGSNTGVAKANPCTEMKEKFKEKKLVSLTQFLGESDSVHFSSSGHIRSQVDIAEGNLAEVGYYLDSCKSRLTRKSVSSCLWRRSIAYIDDDVKKDGSKTVLVEGVDKFELRYIGEGLKEGEWKKTWKTDESGDQITKDTFPLAVEITLGIKQKIKKSSKGKTFAMTIVAPIRFPNNIKKKRQAEAAKEKEEEANNPSVPPPPPGSTPPPPPGS